ncbi:hypothetical protein J1N35_001194 [Gossypium stocksii]|uniref:Reverse transcriptase domain-containing protein n=1 Tax=Gossypium stocksii TaxID=47602 RepID=A0A9D3WJY6_9ROSI|nr:hypothetical protein J1N35_001194 [Gossypium stocksii]
MSGSISSLHSKFTDRIKIWNKEVYGHISSRKKFLSCKLELIEIERERSSSKSLGHVEIEVREELENVFYHEEILWRQKARYDWLVLGDWNTKFFHSRTLKRRNHNRIIALKNSLREWVFDDDMLKLEAVNFYSNLYGEHLGPRRDFPSAAFPGLNNDDFNFLNRQWDHVDASICTWVKEVFKGKSIDPNLNNTLLVLIPKIQNPVKFSQFRPISLCFVLYKIVIKIITNRFEVVFPRLIALEQASFVAGRNITDNIIIA